MDLKHFSILEGCNKNDNPFLNEETCFSNSCSIFTLPNPCEKKSIINVWITSFSVADWVR